MWYLIIALVSIVCSLIMGRLLARANAEQTTNPYPVRGPSLGSVYPAHRDAVAEHAVRRRLLGAGIHLN